jgi:hypothetical protein
MCVTSEDRVRLSKASFLDYPVDLSTSAFQIVPTTTGSSNGGVEVE